MGQIVAVRADPARKGPIISELEPVDGRRRFRVFHSSDVVRDYVEDQLNEIPLEPASSWASALIEQEWLTPAVLRAALVATRLNNPQLDHIYALQAARIRYIPFQFKPVIRMLRADRPRLLIADDVGVGKTIEAGLILKELSTRQSLDRVLVLCPKALTFKWRQEMRRFDEDFRLLTAQGLRYCLDEVRLEGQWPLEYARSIVHYELFRLEPYLTGDATHPGLLELDPPPWFDLVIADEAHHLRTPGTGSHRLIQHLAELSEGLLLLTATPVQLRSDDLFVLLNVLRPDLFPDKSVFDQVIAPNRHLMRAIRLLRSDAAAAGPAWSAEARDELVAASQTPWGQEVLPGDPRYEAVLAELGEHDIPDEHRVRSIRDLEELHSLAFVMNRTRRRDIGTFTVREPKTVPVAFTPEQELVYTQLMELRRDVLLTQYDPRVVRLIVDTLERQAASSINALASAIDVVLTANGFVLSQLSDDAGLDEETLLLPPALVRHAAQVRALAASLPDDDPKFDALRQLVVDTLADEEGPGKVLVFSFFLHTIAYLEKRLTESGTRVGLVTGQIDDAERERLRERFRLARSNPAALDVLLSSEVGCEGLDYEFCDRLVNYDIPWNPMRLEQRIGRIDRFGQRSDKVLIYNFITPGTVEERIFFRCFERLGIFRDTVGDLEEVLGELLQDLTRIALDTSLSLEQADLRARQLADNALRLADEQRRLEAEGGELLGLDEAFVEEVDDVLATGRFVSSADLQALVTEFLRHPSQSSTLTLEGEALVRLQLSEKGRQNLARLLREQLPAGRAAVAFLREVESGAHPLVTFDQATALDRRDVEFVTPTHPLARSAAASWAEERRLLVAAFRARARGIPVGCYAFSCELWETIAVRSETRLVCLAVGLGDGRSSEAVSEQLMKLLAGAHAFDGDLPFERDALTERLRELDLMSEGQRRQAVARLAQVNDELLSRRLASLDAFYENRLSRVRRDLESASEPRIVRMRRSELVRIEREYEARRASLERCRHVEIVTRRVAAGVVEVRHGE